MELNFTFPATITRDRVVYCKELKNKHIFDIQKLLELDNSKNVLHYFDSLTTELTIDPKNLNYIDKLLILIWLRIHCINSYLEVMSKDKLKTAVSLKNVAENLSKNFDINTKITKYKNISLFYSIPVSLITSLHVFDSINCIQVDNEKVFLGDLNYNKKEQILENLPNELVRKFIKEYKSSYIKPINLFKFKLNENETKDFIYDFSFKSTFELLKLLYTNRLKNLLLEQYFFTSKLNISRHDYFEMTPNDTKAMMKIFEDEINVSKKPPSSKPPPGLGHKPL